MTERASIHLGTGRGRESQLGIRHLVLSLPVAGYSGDASKVDMLPLAVAMISHAIAMRWDVVKEIGRM